MKVYVVMGGWDYSGDEIVSVWLTIDEANAEMRRVDAFKRWDTVGVEEVEVGTPMDMSNFR